MTQRHTGSIKRFDEKAIALLTAFSMPAQVNESLAPHAHPRGLSMLAENDSFTCMLFALAAALIAYERLGRLP